MIFRFWSDSGLSSNVVPENEFESWKEFFFETLKKGCQIHLSMFAGSLVLSFGFEGAEIGFGTELAYEAKRAMFFKSPPD